MPRPEHGGRQGGEEFVALFEDVDARGALAAAERIRHAIETAPLALESGTLAITASDALKVAVASIADLLDRQLELVVDEKFNNGLTPNLASPVDHAHDEAGLHHGYKGMQIACPALTAEALKQAAPATVFSRSTEAHNQDKVSMGTIAARDARTVVELTLEVAAIHLHAVCQALDLRGLDRTATVTRQVHAAIRAVVPPVTEDRRMDWDIATIVDLIRTGALRTAARM